jgi:hypothetical protein
MLLLFSQLINPNIEQSLKTSRRKIRQCCVLSELVRPGRSIRCVGSFREAGLEFQSLSELLGETREFIRTGESAKYNEDLLPILQISILNDIGQIVGDDGLEQSEIRR